MSKRNRVVVTPVGIVPAHVSEDVVRSTPWEQRGPGLGFVSAGERKQVKNRLHIDIAPHVSDDRDTEVARLLERGSALVDVGQGTGATWSVLTDPEGNEFCVLSARDMESRRRGAMLVTPVRPLLPRGREDRGRHHPIAPRGGVVVQGSVRGSA